MAGQEPLGGPDGQEDMLRQTAPTETVAPFLRRRCVLRILCAIFVRYGTTVSSAHICVQGSWWHPLDAHCLGLSVIFPGIESGIGCYEVWCAVPSQVSGMKPPTIPI
jgi:hypothetical protein